MALDPIRRADIQSRRSTGGYISPAEEEALNEDASTSDASRNRAVDAAVTAGSGFALGRSGLSNIPGGNIVANSTATFLGDLASGENAKYAANSAARSGRRSLINTLAKEAGYAAFGKTTGGYGVGSLLGGMVNESFKDTPNYTRSALKSAITSPAKIAGLMLGGPLGMFGVGAIADIAVGSSLRDGYLGDWADVRTNEGYRDKLEDDLGNSTGREQYSGLMSTTPGSQLSVLEGGYGPDKSPSGDTLAGNTRSSDPLGDFGRGLTDMFSGGDSDNNSGSEAGRGSDETAGNSGYGR